MHSERICSGRGGLISSPCPLRYLYSNLSSFEEEEQKSGKNMIYRPMDMEFVFCICISFFFCSISAFPSVILSPFTKPQEPHQGNKLRRIMERGKDSCNHAFPFFTFFTFFFTKRQLICSTSLFLLPTLLQRLFCAFFLFFQPHPGVSRGIIFYPFISFSSSTLPMDIIIFLSNLLSLHSSPTHTSNHPHTRHAQSPYPIPLISYT